MFSYIKSGVLDIEEDDIFLLEKYVNNYFDNLDVQEEINNKLNQMVEDGTFNTIINYYIRNKYINLHK